MGGGLRSRLLQLLLVPSALSQLLIPVRNGANEEENVCATPEGRPLGCSLFCRYGLQRGLTAGTCACICDDPCRNLVCARGETCLVRRQGTFFQGQCLASIEECPDGGRSSSCFVSPCLVSLCAGNVTAGALRCVPDYCGGCFAHFFDPQGYEVTRECISKVGIPEGAKEGRCPVVESEFCLNECQEDGDCIGVRKCCKNDCGARCVLPVASEAKLGQCPAASLVPQTSCRTECGEDGECPGVQKCCSNGCARLCAYPADTSDCVYLRGAIEALPDRRLANNFVPLCTADGRFSPVQCDRLHCWCVDERGVELVGTKVLVSSGDRPNCRQPRFPPFNSPTCDSSCPHGLATGQTGFPDPRDPCRCKDLCQGVACPNSFESCQMVTPECSRQPCMPVPRCLLNPCPVGEPMKLPDSGITALCTGPGQCDSSHWCHQIGYSGFGFCCSGPASAIKEGSCPLVQPRAGGNCIEECRVDSSCPEEHKCCFNGCGLSCMRVRAVGPAVRPGQCPRNAVVPVNAQTSCLQLCASDADCPGQDKCCSVGCDQRCVPVTTVTSVGPAAPQIDGPRAVGAAAAAVKLGECPALLSPLASSGRSCGTKCAGDGDCPGLKKCCANGCGTECVYPLTTTGCLQAVITAELLRRPQPQCDPQGNFKPVQCDGSANTCWCVDEKGREVAGTRAFGINAVPNCGAPRDCPVTACGLLCPFGRALDAVSGCEACSCLDPCEGVVCPLQGHVCTVVPAQCYPGAPCPPQARCVAQFCPRGQARRGLASGVLQLCGPGREGCERDFWCHRVGLGGPGAQEGLGVCCQGPQRTVKPGACPKRDYVFDATDCRLNCQVDEDCAGSGKCCFDGCGLSCSTATDGRAPTSFSVGSSVGAVTPPPLRPVSIAPPPLRPVSANQKIGTCPSSRPDACFTDIAECSSDDQCQGQLKCCNDGCAPRCVRPERTTSCLHLRAALEAMVPPEDFRPASRGPPVPIPLPSCTPEGAFERVQCGFEWCWCVEDTGQEFPGTRVRRGQTPNCRAPRICPSLSCRLSCQLGLRIDPSTGCPTCACASPCQSIQCPFPHQVCIHRSVECLGRGPCPPVPECVANSCASGEVAREPQSQDVALCHRSDRPCSVGYCDFIGQEERGFCCSGTPPVGKAGVCPLLVASPGACRLECRQDQDCPGAAKCCDNGCGTQCAPPSSSSTDAQPGECPRPTAQELNSPTCRLLCSSDGECGSGQKCCSAGCSRLCKAASFGAAPGVQPPVTAVAGQGEKAGLCPEVPQRRDCPRGGRDTCASDAVCPGLRKCCSDGCFRSCVYADITTGCLHRRGAAIELATRNGVVDPLVYVPQCTEDGAFVDVQCHPATGLCWCLDVEGLEMIGTRVERGETAPCRSPRLCQRLSGCQLRCPHGFRLDGRGCETCACDDPCSDVRCPLPWQQCRVFGVKCFREPCLPVGRCVVNPCARGQPAEDPQRGEVLECAGGGECPTAHFCRSLGLGFNGGGLCCPGSAPSRRPVARPVCPRLHLSAVDEASVLGLCRRDCTVSEECREDEACCFNGCGLSCYSPGARVLPAPAVDDKPGTCPAPRDEGSGRGCSNLCSGDGSCPGAQKCCSTGCGRECTWPSAATSCVHQRSAGELLVARGHRYAGRLPDCAPDGSFRQRQCHRDGRCWCVDRSGNEIAGTRGLSRVDCSAAPRTCPTVTCPTTAVEPINCPYTRKLDSQGCPTCDCTDPCAEVECGFGQSCVLVGVRCVEGQACRPVPRCLPAVCPSSGAVVGPDGGLQSCASDQDCSFNAWCRSAGMGPGGFCCVGTRPREERLGSCPALPLASAIVDPAALCRAQCRLDSECRLRSQKCCFNGCGSQCREAAVKEKVGSCPLNPISNPGCRRECSEDTDCSGFRKCCAYGCGSKCQAPNNATACIQWRASLLDVAAGRPDVHVPACDASGDFAPVQTLPATGQTWCVNPASGVEVPGTRVRTPSRPDCDRPRLCPASCSRICPHGLVLDDAGCPPAGRCDCRDPCTDLSCPLQGHVCFLRRGSCLREPCPPTPTCGRNPCGASTPLANVDGSLSVCTVALGDAECVGGGECRPVGDGVGLCCRRDAAAVADKPGRCPAAGAALVAGRGCAQECSDDQGCQGPAKCCVFGCARVCAPPDAATNCAQLRAAVETLLSDTSSTVAFPTPSCDPVTGLFSQLQCLSRSGLEQCRCVEPTTGVEIPGTRQPRLGANCANRRSCPVTCPESSISCPYGIELDSQGCPVSSVCACANPCSQVRCGPGEVCLLKPKACSEATCLPLPVCERNLCRAGDSPAVEPRTFAAFTCSPDGRGRKCPQGFNCAAFAVDQSGYCCPESRDGAGTTQVSVVVGGGSPGFVSEACPHGQSHRVLGLTQSCGSGREPCPGQYYCKIPGNAAAGICCPTSEFVCAMKLDAGPCSSPSSEAWAFDFNQKKCLKFIFGGCQGNDNRFDSERECQRFCGNVGRGDPDILTGNKDASDGLVAMTVELAGPRVKSGDLTALQAALRSYVSTLGPRERDVLFLRLEPDTSKLSFSLGGPEARAQADVISDVIRSKQFRLEWERSEYVALAETLEVPQRPLVSEEGSTAFLGLIVSCVIFGVVILIALITAIYVIHRRRSKSHVEDGGGGGDYATPYPTPHPLYISSSHSDLSRGAAYPAPSGNGTTAGSLASLGGANGAYQSSLPRRKFSMDDVDAIGRASDVPDAADQHPDPQHSWRSNTLKSHATNPRHTSHLYY